MRSQRDLQAVCTAVPCPIAARGCSTSPRRLLHSDDLTIPHGHEWAAVPTQCRQCRWQCRLDAPVGTTASVRRYPPAGDSADSADPYPSI